MMFIFAATLQEMANGLYMLYFVKPFNIGDLVRINNGETLIVKEVGVLTTFFHTLEGYGVYRRNADIAKSELINYNVGERIAIFVKFGVALETTTEQMSTFIAKISEYMCNSPIWADKFVLNAEGIEVGTSFVKVTLEAYLKNGGRWQESLRWKTAKTALIFEIEKIAKSISIKLGPISNKNKKKVF